MADLKEFLKPTPLKIILFVLFPFFLAQTGFMICVMAPCGGPTFGFLPLVFAVFSYAESGFSPIYLVGAIPSYLLACVFAHFRNNKAETGKRPADIKSLNILIILLSITPLAIFIIAVFGRAYSCSDCSALDWLFGYPQIFFLMISALGFVCSFLLIKMKKTGFWLSVATGIISIIVFFFIGIISLSASPIWYWAIVLWAYVVDDLWTKRKLFA